MDKQAKHFYEFGLYRLNPASRLLLHEGTPVALTPKVFDTLLILVENNGELIEKERLIKELWPDSFVEESNLTYNISVLRKALGTKAADQQYIATVSGYGYRFIADVKRVEETPDEAIIEPQTETPFAQPASKNTIAAFALLLALAFGGVLAYRVIRQPTPVKQPQLNSPAKSIAVLPFRLLDSEESGSEIEYLSDGISESLINNLSQLDGLKVIARYSAFKYKGKDTDPEEVAKALGVEAVLIGQILKRGEQLQISVELVDARDKTQIWGEQFNRKATDLLQVQTEISRKIAERLQTSLTAVERQQLAKHETVNPEAYELLLKGRFYTNKGGTENQKRSIEYYQQAIAVDPSYALAYAELSITYDLLCSIGILDPKEYKPKAEVAAYKALEHDDSLAEAHLAMGTIKMNAWDWVAAEREFKRAVELNQNLSRTPGYYAYYQMTQGRYEQAIAMRKRDRELDPLSPHANYAVGFTLLLAHQNDQAIEAAMKMLELFPGYPDAYALLGYAQEEKGRYREAIAAYQQAIKLGDHSPDIQIYLGSAYAKAGERSKARAILNRLEAHKNISHLFLTDLYVALGKREQALASLERAYAAHENHLEHLVFNPHLDPLRSDPRFQELLRKIGLTP